MTILAFGVMSLVIVAVSFDAARGEVAVSMLLIVMASVFAGGLAGVVSTSRARRRKPIPQRVVPPGALGLVAGVSLAIVAGPAWLKVVTMSLAAGGLFTVGFFDPGNWRSGRGGDTEAGEDHPSS